MVVAPLPAAVLAKRGDPLELAAALTQGSDPPEPPNQPRELRLREPARLAP